MRPAEVNHIGHCVSDVERATAFYLDVLGFVVERELKPDDTPSAQLLGLTPPLGMTARYLRRGGTVLELLHFAHKAPPSRDVRVMNEVGLTHFSFSVEDINQALIDVAAHGGTVLDDTNIGGGVFVRDPDGQLIELLPWRYYERFGRKSEDA